MGNFLCEDAGLDKASMLEEARAFCGAGVPILIGSEQYGLNLEDIKEICFDDTLLSQDNIEDCAERETSWEDMQRAAQTYVSAWDEAIP